MSPFLNTFRCRTAIRLYLGMALVFAISFAAFGSAGARSLRINHPDASATATIVRANSAHSPRHSLLVLINKHRAKLHLKALKLSKKQSRCALKHSKAMASDHKLFHANSICVKHSTWAQNVGGASGSKMAAIKVINNLMWKEGPCPTACAPGSAGYALHNHYLNLANRHFRQIGIGIAVTGDFVYVTEDFVG